MVNRFKALGICLLLLVILLSGCTSKEEQAAIDAFNEASLKLEAINSELDKSILDAETIIAANEKAFDENAIGTLETAVSIAKSLKVTIPEKPKELESIKSEIEKLNNTDYTSLLQQIADSRKAYEDSVKQLKQVTAPAESFVIERIQAIGGITGISAVTEDNDPNGKLGKQGGYTAQVYFSYNLVNQANVSGNSIIEKGTNSGGSLEVYNTVEEAEKRNSYLSTFDGGIFASGSHRVVGTVVVRTSDQLTASQQKDLEAKLIYSLIELDSMNDDKTIFSVGECIYKVSPTWKQVVASNDITYFYPSGTTSNNDGMLMVQSEYIDIENDLLDEFFDGSIQGLEKYLTNIKILEQKNIRIANSDGRKLYLSGNSNEDVYEFESVIFINNGICYTFIFTHKDNITSSLNSDFNKIVQSISFVNNNTPNIVVPKVGD